MGSEAVTTMISEEELVRSHLYGLLSAFLSAPPSDAVMEVARGLSGDETPLGEAFVQLALAATEASIEDAEDEYNTLFIGVTHGDLVPYASHYKTGFLNDTPLSDVRTDLATMGIERAPDIKDPEDHIGFLFEVMCGMVNGTLCEADLSVQKHFFDAHIADWAPRFFKDLEEAENARLFKPLGTIGRLFLEIETEAFQMSS